MLTKREWKAIPIKELRPHLEALLSEDEDHPGLEAALDYFGVTGDYAVLNVPADQGTESLCEVIDAWRPGRTVKWQRFWLGIFGSGRDLVIMHMVDTEQDLTSAEALGTEAL
jgi:hypothetical protein